MGLIPAHAGKTTSSVPASVRRRAHPRSRGENRTQSTGSPHPAGSSPLTRGKPLPRPRTHPRRRLIPAHAGKTCECDAAGGAGGAHPRSRGENQHDGPVTVEAHGSSPLTRGKPDALTPDQKGAGLIPAHAGKTRGGSGRAGTGPAHPRSRGENLQRCAWPSPQSGSSPLTRGKPWAWGRRAHVVRLIPAHAGKTVEARDARSGHGAHPRSRGENGWSPWGASSAPGSSPLTRGKR